MQEVTSRTKFVGHACMLKLRGSLLFVGQNLHFNTSKAQRKDALINIQESIRGEQCLAQTGPGAVRGGFGGFFQYSLPLGVRILAKQRRLPGDELETGLALAIGWRLGKQPDITALIASFSTVASCRLPLGKPNRNFILLLMKIVAQFLLQIRPGKRFLRFLHALGRVDVPVSARKSHLFLRLFLSLTRHKLP